MKNLTFLKRMAFARAGIAQAFRHEKSFRTQVLCAVAAYGLLIVLRPQPLWWAVFTLIVGGVLSAELINTALEAVLDHLHPTQHPAIKVAKDCAAGAVLVLSLSALAILAALLVDTLN